MAGTTATSRDRAAGGVPDSAGTVPAANAEGPPDMHLDGDEPVTGTVEDRLRLAVAYDVTSSSPLELTEALGDRWDIVWVVDTSDPALGSWIRVLPRLGHVVDRGGRPAAAVAADLADEAVDGVIAFTDSQLHLAAELAARLGLEGNPPEVVEALIDKGTQRRTLAAAGVPGPRFAVVAPGARPAEVARLVDGVTFPVVVKPLRGSGSRDTVLAPDTEAVLHHVAVHGHGPEGGWIVEEWLGELDTAVGGRFGAYVSVEAVAQQGEIVPLAVTGKFRLADPFRETGNFLPHLLDPVTADAVVEMALRAARALRVRTGALHIEVKLTPDGPRILELNGRVGGGSIDALFAMVHGPTLTELAATVAAGRSVDPGTLDSRLAPDSFAYAHFTQAPTDAVALEGIAGLDTVGGLDGVVATTVNRTVGDPLDWRVGSQGYVVAVRGLAADRDELGRVPAQVGEALDITYARAKVPARPA